MRTVTTSNHVLHLAEHLLSERGVAPLTEEQKVVLAEAIDRWYGVPLATPRERHNR